MSVQEPDFSAYVPPLRAGREPRVVDAETALAAIPDGARVLTPGVCGTPLQMLEALDEQRERWTSLEIVTGNLLEEIAPLRHANAPFRFTAWQLSRAYKDARAANAVSIISTRYSHSGALFRPDGPQAVDVALVSVSKPGPDGRYSLGTSVGVVIDAVRTAPLVIAQVNEQMPYTYGVSELPREAFDFLVEMDGPLAELKREPPGAVADEVAKNVVSLVRDGATLQFGIGAVPEAIMARLAERRELGVHSGLISDGVIDLVEAGALTGERKPIDAGLIVAGEIGGTRRLFDWVDHNPLVRMAPARYTHGAPTLAKCRGLVAINSAVQVGLDGAINAESVRGSVISGPGGQPDFAEGVFLAPEAVGIIAMPSTAAGGKVSRIVRRLGEDAVVTVARSLADRVVTEYGVAELRGRTLDERASALRAIAHPDFRDGLGS